MAKAKKLKSGNWRCLVYDYTDENGKRHYESFTAETKKEAEYLAAEFSLNKKQNQKVEDMTISTAITKYCTAKENILSPSTIREYERMQRTYFKGIENISIKKINREVVQIWVNTFAINHSPKTVRNAFGLLSAVLDMYAPSKIIKVTLPQKEKPELYVPSDQDVQRIIRYLHEHDQEMEKAVMLAAFGPLRRSEICALRSEDIKGNFVTIRQAEVINKSNEYVTKSTKTYSSQRVIEFPPFVIERISGRSGRIVELNPNQISKRFPHILHRLGIPHFRFHDLRHYTASIMHAIGIPDQYILGRGGWSSEKSMNIYKDRINTEEKKFTNIILEHFEDMQHEIQHENKKTLVNTRV